MTAPNPNQVRAGVATTPSTAVSPTPIATATAPAPTPDEIVFDAFTEAVAGSTTSGQRATLAVLAVEALREAGFDL